MVSRETLDAIEGSIVRELRIPDEPKGRTPEELEKAIKRQTYPVGASDTVALVDYTLFALAADNVYAIPVANEEHARQVSATAGTIVGLYDYLRTDTTIIPLRVADAIGLQVDRLAASPAYAFKVLGESVNTVAELNPADANEVDLRKLRELAEKIDGLIQINGYEFDIFQPGTVNLGLMLVYRQEWTPTRYQTGELLSTIPLAPGERVRYETKTWQTAKTAQEINETTTYSTEEVLSTTKRDVLDVLARVSKKFGIQAQAEGKVNWGVFSGNSSVKSSVDYERESKVSKQQFREAISKSVQSIKNERKVSVNIATEVGSETRMTREIANPNDEITVTYLFYELQRIYEVKEYLYDAIPVVFIANDIPTADEINDDWVIRNDWIIAGAILDKSFIETLAFVTNELPGLEYAMTRAVKVYEEALSVVDVVKARLAEEQEKIKTASDQLQAIGTSLGDILSAMRTIGEARQRSALLRAQIKDAMAPLKDGEERASKATFDHEQGRKRADRLLNHVRDNILHYMRAVWNAEDLNQRYLRLRAILYPQIDLVGAELDADGTPVNPKFEVKEWYPVSDVVDTNRPLGHLGNYTAYRLMRVDNAMVNWMAQSFLRTDANGDKEVSDPDADAAPDEVKLEVKIPSDAVYIEALPGTAPLLEHFKLVHRAIDKDKARHEVIRQQLENLRRLELIRKGDFGDPEIEKAVITDAKSVLVAGLGQ